MKCSNKIWLLAVFVIVAFYGCEYDAERKLGENEIRFSQSASSSAGERWECSLSNETVLQEKDYFTRQFLGPGYRQHWIFEIVGAGEVTIFWQQYFSLSSKRESYSVTYSFDEEGKYTIVSDSRLEAKEAAEKVMDVFVRKDGEQLLEYFCEDIRENRREETLREMEETFSFLDGEISSCSYDARRNDIQQKHKDFHVYFWNGYVFFQIATTEGKAYTVILYYIHTWEKHPEYEGVEAIKIWNEEKEEVEVVRIGKWYDSLFPEDEEDENLPTPEPTPTLAPTLTPSPTPT